MSGTYELPYSDTNPQIIELQSLGCVELNDVFYELQALNGVVFVSCHEDGPVETYTELVTNSQFVDFREGMKTNIDDQELLDLVLKEVDGKDLGL